MHIRKSFRTVNNIAELHSMQLLWYDIGQFGRVEKYRRNIAPDFIEECIVRFRVNAHIGRPPGYGMTYTIGAMQLQKMLVDRRRQLGDAFRIKDFHDYLMNTGRLPVSLLRYDLTGLDDEVGKLWAHVPLAKAMAADGSGGTARSAR